MNLSHLSIQHCKRGVAPRAPTAEERKRAFYAVRPLPAANGYPWPHVQANSRRT
jgi:hypothetical protein